MKNYEGFINQVPRPHYGEMLIICNKCGTENHFHYDDTYCKHLEDKEKDLLERIVEEKRTIGILTKAFSIEKGLNEVLRKENEELKIYKTKFYNLKKYFDENILKT